MKIKNKKARRILWEVRRYALIFGYYAFMMVAVVLALYFVVCLPAIISNFIFWILGI